MSFVDLATLTIHRRHEMETRINCFLEKSGHAAKELKKLELQAQGFVQRLNCEPSELKERYLWCMRQLEEYMYIITDFNLALGKLEEAQNVDVTPVLDPTSKPICFPSTPFNIIDVLSESAPSTSTVCSNHCPTESPRAVEVNKPEQVLIEFSSGSCSSESVPPSKEDKEVQCEPVTEADHPTNNEAPSTSMESTNLPAQVMLQTEQMYPATIMSTDGTSFWIITDDNEAVCKLMTDMTDYYKANTVAMSVEEVTSLHYCAFYDHESDAYYRAFFIKVIEDTAEVFLVDTGEMRTGELRGVQPLRARYCAAPPYARCCHLAGVDTLIGDSEDLMAKQEQFMKRYIGTQCHIEVDDNSSESMDVYVILPNCKESLNELIVQEGLAVSIDKVKTPAKEIQGPPEFDDSDIDLLDCPEHEDPVEAVTGYSNRDEVDICKHYKGGPDKTCFKGSRCKKRHVAKHPDGWTLDKVEAYVCKSLPLPPPDSWHKVVVTYVCHFNRAFVQYVTDEKDELPSFGVVMPAKTLTALVRDMNSPATRLAYKALTTIPALGEMVAALYPLDGMWYRARITSVCRPDQNVEVMYVDYGNTVWVKEDEIRALPVRCAALPAQAVRTRLAGVGAAGGGAAGGGAAGGDSKLWVRAQRALQDMVLQKTLMMHIVARAYEELTVELYNDDVNIAEELAKQDMVKLEDYTIEDDSKVTHKLIVP